MAEEGQEFMLWDLHARGPGASADLLLWLESAFSVPLSLHIASAKTTDESPSCDVRFPKI